MSITDYSKFGEEFQDEDPGIAYPAKPGTDDPDYIEAVRVNIQSLTWKIDESDKIIIELEAMIDRLRGKNNRERELLGWMNENLNRHLKELAELNKAGCEPVEVDALHKLTAEFPYLFIKDNSCGGGIKLHITGKSWVPQDYDTIRSFFLTAKDHKENTIKFSSIHKNEDGSFGFQFVANPNGVPEKALKNLPNPFQGRQIYEDKAPYFQDAKVGDLVKDERFGVGRITEIKIDNEHPLIVEYHLDSSFPDKDCGDKTYGIYTLDGADGLYLGRKLSYHKEETLLYFHDAKVGDKVVDSVWGEGKIEAIKSSGNFPLVVSFTDGVEGHDEIYNLDGCLCGGSWKTEPRLRYHWTALERP